MINSEGAPAEAGKPGTEDALIRFRIDFTQRAREGPSGPGRGISPRYSAGTMRSAGWSISSAGAGKTTPSAWGSPARARPPWWKASPFGSWKTTCPTCSGASPSSGSTWASWKPAPGSRASSTMSRHPKSRSSSSSTRPIPSWAPARRPGAATPPTSSSRPWPGGATDRGRHHLDRVQKVFRKGPGPGPPVSGGQARRAQRGLRHPHPPGAEAELRDRP